MKVLGSYELELTFDDGTVGTVDLAEFAGRGVFRDWLEPGMFEKVNIDSSGALEWPGGIDICPDSLYMMVTGKTPEEVFPRLRSGIDA